MFDHKHYIPVLRWKLGERLALRNLSDDVKASLTPFIELVPESQKKKKDPILLSERIVEQIIQDWGTADLLLDPNNIIDRANANELLLGLFNAGIEKGLKLIPTVRLSRDDAYLAVMKKVISPRYNSICLRLFRKDIQNRSLKSEIDALLGGLNLQPRQVDLLIDLQIIENDSDDVEAIIEIIPHLLLWRSLAIVSGAISKDLGNYSVGQHSRPRMDWQFWLKGLQKTLKRVPTFGDYATIHPFLPEFIPGMNVSASIKYTTVKDWIIMRGEGLRNEGGPGYAQYPANAQLLTERQEYCGSEFSFGDSYIKEKASHIGGTGNPRSWLTAGVNHHLTFVVKQLSNLF